MTPTVHVSLTWLVTLPCPNRHVPVAALSQLRPGWHGSSPYLAYRTGSSGSVLSAPGSSHHTVGGLHTGPSQHSESGVVTLLCVRTPRWAVRQWAAGGGQGGYWCFPPSGGGDPVSSKGGLVALSTHGGWTINGSKFILLALTSDSVMTVYKSCTDHWQC